MAILWLGWRCWSILGSTSAIEGAHDDAMWVQFGGYNSGVSWAFYVHDQLHHMKTLPQIWFALTAFWPPSIQWIALVFDGNVTMTIQSGLFQACPASVALLNGLMVPWIRYVPWDSFVNEVDRPLDSQAIVARLSHGIYREWQPRGESCPPGEFCRGLNAAADDAAKRVRQAMFGRQQQRDSTAPLSEIFCALTGQTCWDSVQLSFAWQWCSFACTG